MHEIYVVMHSISAVDDWKLFLQCRSLWHMWQAIYIIYTLLMLTVSIHYIYLTYMGYVCLYIQYMCLHFQIVMDTSKSLSIVTAFSCEICCLIQGFRVIHCLLVIAVHTCVLCLPVCR